MRRIAAILLLASFAAMSSGLMGYLHHHFEYEQQARSQSLARSWSQPPDEPGHDESTCTICMTLHAPVMSAGYTPTLIFLGLFVAFLTQLPRSFTSVRVPLTLDSRGPPSL